MSDIAPQRGYIRKSIMELGSVSDPVNHPAHYKKGGIETIDVLEAKLTPEEFQGYCIGNALKYLTRRNYKGKPEEDMRKAHWYLSRALKHVEPVPKVVHELKGDPMIITYPNCEFPRCESPKVGDRSYCKNHKYLDEPVKDEDDGE